MLNLKLLFSLSLCIIFIYAGATHDKPLRGTEIHLDRISNECRGRQNVPCHGYFQGIKAISGTGTLLLIRNYTLVVKEGGFKNLMLTITLERCLSRENLDTCEEFLKQPNIDFCKSLDPKYANISRTPNFPLIPPFKCPFKKGIHHAYNFTYDLSPFLFFEVNGYYWKYKSEVVVPGQNRAIYCISAEFHSTNSKIKRN